MTNDDKIVLLKETIKQKKETLGKEPRFTPVTSCNLKLDFGINTNIHTMSDIKSVNNALISLGIYELVAQNQGIDPSDVEINGFSLAEWKTDLTNKKKQLEFKKKKKELDSYEVTLNGLMSESKKTELVIADIEKILNA